MDFITWHFTQGTKKFLEIWKNYLGFFWWYFGISRHFWTLFSSWKRDISRVGRRGFHPVLWIQSVFENIVTRFLGAIVRSFVIIIGVFVELIAAPSGFFIFLIWLFSPLLIVVFGIGAVVSSLYGAASFALSGIFLFLISIFLFYASIRSYLAQDKSASEISLENFASQPWFSRVWQRIGKDPTGEEVSSFSNPENLKEFLRSCDITPEEFQKIIEWEKTAQDKKEQKRKFWLKANLYNTLPIGQNWTYAYTVHLDRHSTDLSEGDPTEYKESKLVGHVQDLELLELILTRPSQNSAFIIGEAGVGKRTLVHTLAKKIREKTANPYLIGKRVLEINIGEIFTGLTDQGRIENVLRSIFFEAAYAGNIILVIDNLGHFLKSNPKNPGDDISAVLAEFLAAPTFQIVGLANPAEFHENIEKKEGLMKYFDKVQLEEMTGDQTLEVLLYNLKDMESEGVIFTFQALREIIKLSDRYITDSPFPEKALDLMEEVLLFWSQAPAEKYIGPQTVSEVVSKKIKVPLGEMRENEKEKLANLEEIMHKRVVGQEFAIQQIAETMRRARVGMASSTKPIGSFLFLGPTGVGKTESAKTLAEAYFGDEHRMIRLDMSEYRRADSTDRLLGSVEINMTGQLTNKVKENPYAILLLDEIEKAHPDILNLFLQILDEGWLTDAFGKKINFRNLIIIATSNAGSDFIKAAIDSGMDPQELQDKLTDHIIKEGIFRPEFLNRFEGVIFFHPLSKIEITRVAELLLEKYAQKLKKEENINIQFDSGIAEYTVQKGYDRKFGARSIDRFIQDSIGDKIVKKLISGEIKKGDDFSLGVEELLAQ
ncbi:MAG: AAA family ATPase [Candidatus Moranbacteria bacterium]|nr:AAA family ATPase [Candidatus Moranbacteria bacterium]